MICLTFLRKYKKNISYFQVKNKFGTFNFYYYICGRKNCTKRNPMT